MRFKEEYKIYFATALIVLVALVLFAPTRIPGLVRGAKNMVSEFRKEVRRNDQEKGTATDTPKKLKS